MFAHTRGNTHYQPPKTPKDCTTKSSNMQPKKFRWTIAIVPGIGVLLAVVGAILAICFDDIFQAILAQNVKLSPTSKTYPIWKQPPGPIFFDIYFFNWTNPEDITNPDIKPNFVEMGPYRFREVKQKVNITWNDSNSTISYRQMRTWFFDEEGSNGTLDDNITLVNAIAASAAYTSRFKGFFVLQPMSYALSAFNQKVSVTHSAGELLFEGYQDGLLDFANSLPIETNAPKVDKFGWFYNRNGSIENDGYFNMGTGADSIKSFGVLKNWNYNNTTSFYPGKCGKIDGSAGEFYNSKLSKTQQLTMFSPDLCRRISFDFESVVSVKGISAFKYSGGDSIMDNGTIHKENRCYCVGECQPSGLLNVSTCRYGSPAFISFPHFYLADPFYLNAVDGLSPDKEKHQFYMALEPTTGIPVDVAARFQLNFLISPNSNIKLYKNVPRIFLPVLWFEQHVVVNDYFVDGIKSLLKVPVMGNTIGLTIFVLGVIIILWSPVRVNLKACFRKKKKKEASPEKRVDDSKIIMNNLRTPKQRVNVLPSVQDIDEDENEDEVQEEKAVLEPLNQVNNDLKQD